MTAGTTLGFSDASVLKLLTCLRVAFSHFRELKCSFQDTLNLLYYFSIEAEESLFKRCPIFLISKLFFLMNFRWRNELGDSKNKWERRLRIKVLLEIWISGLLNIQFALSKLVIDSMHHFFLDVSIFSLLSAKWKFKINFCFLSPCVLTYVTCLSWRTVRFSLCMSCLFIYE